MKVRLRSIVCLLPALLAGCQHVVTAPASPNVPPAPAIYRSFCLDASLGRHAHELRGYGAGADISEARRGAYQDLAEKISVSVKAETMSLTERNRAGDVVSALRNQVDTHSTAVLPGVEQVCLDDAGDPSGKIHIGVRLDLRSAAAQAAERWRNQYRNKSFVWRGSPALLESVFFKDFLQQLTESEQSAGESATAGLKLFKQLDGWQLQALGQPLFIQAQSLNDLVNWSALQHGELRFSPLDMRGGLRDGRIRAGEDFRLRVNSGEAGFLTVLNIYGNGEVGVLRKNWPVSASVDFPAVGALSLSLLPDQIRGQEVFVAVFSRHAQQPQALNLPPESSERMQALLDWLASEDVAVSALLMNVIK